MKLKILGIDVSVSPLFFGVITFMLLTDKSGTALAAVLAIITHELGHIVAMKFCKRRIKSVDFSPSAILIKGNCGASFWDDLLVYSAGVISNLFFAVFFFIAQPLLNHSLLFYIAAQILIAAINIIPAEGTDGGAILKLLLQKLFNAWELIFRVVSILFGIVSLLITIIFVLNGWNNPSILLFGIYIFIVALIKV